MRRLWLISVFVASAALAAPTKKAPKKPVEPQPVVTCDAYVPCEAVLLEAFESTDYERAQRLALKLEALTSTNEEKARWLVVMGALDAQSLGLTEATRDTVKRRFSEALRLVPSMLFTSIPSFARTDALEALFEQARKEAEPKVLTPEPKPEPPPLVVTALPPPPPVAKKFPLVAAVFGGLALAGVGVFAGTGVSSLEDQRLLGLEQQPGPNNDVRVFELWSSANTKGLVGIGGLIGAGVFTLAAVIALLATQ
jgi:hypothetical protein